MENEPTTKTPIPAHRASLFCLLSPVFCFLSPVSCLLSSVFCLLSPAFCFLSSVFCPTRPSCPACPPSTLVETPLQITLFSAKQTQFQNGQYRHKYNKNKGLCQRTTDNEQRTLSKTNPIPPTFFRVSASAQKKLLRIPTQCACFFQILPLRR
jgi:hypothetical protein